MKAIMAALALAIPAQLAHATAPSSPAPPYREGEVLVKYRGGANSAAANRLRADLGLVALRPGLGHDVDLLALPPFTTTAAALRMLRTHPAIAHAEPNFHRTVRSVVPNDPYFGLQWALRNTGQSGGTAGADINMVNAWDADGDGAPDRVGRRDIVVAVIDDAVEIRHPDLSANVVGGRDFVCGDDNPSPNTADASHGTLVSGCIAGRGDNSVGVAGVAWQTGLLPLKFAFDVATHLEALQYARGQGAAIINASFGGPGFSVLERDAIAALADADILYVAAAGNEDSNIDVAQLSYPANYDVDNVITAAATDRNDNLSTFSQYGPLSVDVAAPGQAIVTTAINGGYATSGVSGTSFAAPHTAGVAALIKAHVRETSGPVADFREIRARLIESGTVAGAGNAMPRTVGGRIDANSALTMAPRPALVLTDVAFTGGDGDGALDAGELLQAQFTVRNLWLDATGVTATLVVDNAGVTVATASVALGDVLSQASVVAPFDITVGAVSDHRYVTFTLTLTAGGYSAERRFTAEIGDLDPPESLSQAFNASGYDEFHAWQVDIPPGAEPRTLVIRASSAVDIDLLAKHGAPPRYSISVGIDPETDFGYFCTSGTTADCRDPATLISGRQDGIEAITIVNPPVGTLHLVVVNFAQAPYTYTLSATLVPGDLRPDPFDLVDRTRVTAGSVVTSNSVTITGIDSPTFVTIAGGSYSINNAPFTGEEGTVSAGDVIRVRASATAGYGHAELTVGGFTETFWLNEPPSPIPQSTDTSCGAPAGGGGGGALSLSLLAGIGVLAVLRRRRP